jgi:hypothetical protein
MSGTSAVAALSILNPLSMSEHGPRETVAGGGIEGDPSKNVAMVAGLKARLGVADAAIAQLVRQNGLLREQVESWHRAGENVANREATLRNLLQEAKRQVASREIPVASLAQMVAPALANSVNSTPTMSAGVPQAALPSTVLSSTGTRSQSKFARTWMSGLFGEFWLFCFVTVLAYALRHSLLKYFEPDPTQVGKRKVVRSYGSLTKGIEPLGRMLGVIDYVVDVAEIRVGNIDSLLVNSPVFMRISVGKGQYARTQGLMVPSDCSNLLFDEEFQVTMSKADAPCFISLVEMGGASEEIATAEIPAKQFVRMATDQSEYFRFEFLVQNQRLQESPALPTRGPPYLAMRLRDASHRDALAGDAPGVVPELQSS